jgi:hypothetical protein
MPVLRHYHPIGIDDILTACCPLIRLYTTEAMVCSSGGCLRMAHAANHMTLSRFVHVTF